MCEVAVQLLGTQLDGPADLGSHVRGQPHDDLVEELEVERAVLMARPAEARLGAEDLEAAGLVEEGEKG